MSAVCLKQANGFALAASCSRRPRRNGEGAEMLFTIEDGSGETVNVSYTGLVPDLFREGEGVVATGRFDAGLDVFMAEEILAKHDENYQPRELGRGRAS